MIRHRYIDGDDRHWDAHQKAVKHLPGIGEPRKLWQLTEQRPPHEHRCSQKRQMLDDVQTMVRHRRVVEGWQVPERNGDIEDDERDLRSREELGDWANAPPRY